MKCMADIFGTGYTPQTMLTWYFENESGGHGVRQVCLHCGGGGGRLQIGDSIMCDSLDCGVFFERRKAAGEAAAAEALCQAALALF